MIVLLLLLLVVMVVMEKVRDTTCLAVVEARP